MEKKIKSDNLEKRKKNLPFGKSIFYNSKNY